MFGYAYSDYAYDVNDESSPSNYTVLMPLHGDITYHRHAQLAEPRQLTGIYPQQTALWLLYRRRQLVPVQGVNPLDQGSAHAAAGTGYSDSCTHIFISSKKFLTPSNQLD